MKHISFVIVGASLFLVSCSAPDAGVSTDQVTIAASFYPLAHIAQKVGGEHVRVTTLTPVGGEPHDFEPTPKDVALMESADLLLLNGGGIDAWADEPAANRITQGKSVMLFLDFVDPIAFDEEDHEGHEGEEEGHEEEHEHGAIDPHAWLDPLRLRAMVFAVGVELANIDPENADAYRSNADAYAAELAVLDQEFVAGLAHCKQHEIIAAHDAYGYLAARYALVVHPIAGVSPEQEPSPQRMAELTQLIKEHGISTVFFETLTAPKLAETIAREAGAKTAVLNPIEGLTQADQQADEEYLSLMRENMTALRQALSCQ